MIKDRYLKKIVADSKRREITIGMIEQATQEKSLDYNRCFVKNCTFLDAPRLQAQMAAQQNQASAQMAQARGYGINIQLGQMLGVEVGTPYNPHCPCCGK